MFWNFMKLFSGQSFLVICCVHIAYLHTLIKHQSLPFPWKDRGFFSVAELSTNPRRVRSRGSKTEKGQNRASKTEGSQKPIVKIWSESKADSQSPKTSQKPKNSRKIHCKNSPNAQKHQPHKSPKLPTENSRKESSYTALLAS